MELEDVMKIWAILRVKKNIGFADITNAIHTTVGIGMVPIKDDGEVLPWIKMPKCKPPKGSQKEPMLGLATCKELLEELSARIEIHGPGLGYRTVDGD